MTLQEAAKNPRALFVRSGVLFDVFNPNEEDIKLEDIIHALSNLCRYGGHSPFFYSVAQHSVLCSYKGKTAQECLEMLMHDAAEAYMLDFPTPLKRQFPEYMRIENALLGAIFKKYELNFPLSDSIHQADNEMLRHEWHCFNIDKEHPFEYWTPRKSKREFIKRYNQLVRQINKDKKNATRKN